MRLIGASRLAAALPPLLSVVLVRAIAILKQKKNGGKVSIPVSLGKVPVVGFVLPGLRWVWSWINPHGTLLRWFCNFSKTPSGTFHWPSTVRSGEWPAWFSFLFSGRWRSLAKGTAWAFFYCAITLLLPSGTSLEVPNTTVEVNVLPHGNGGEHPRTSALLFVVTPFAVATAVAKINLGFLTTTQS